VMVGRKVCVGVEMAVGPGDPAGLNVVDGVLRHASVPVFRPFGGRWQLGGNHCLGSVGCRMGEGGKANSRVEGTGRGNQEELGQWSVGVGASCGGCCSASYDKLGNTLD
jgi:hypothetical protein